MNLSYEERRALRRLIDRERRVRLGLASLSYEELQPLGDEERRSLVAQARKDATGPRPCAACRETFTPRRWNEQTCSPPCSRAHKTAAARERKRRTRALQSG